jgi:hypothetical protein
VEGLQFRKPLHNPEHFRRPKASMQLRTRAATTASVFPDNISQDSLYSTTCAPSTRRASPSVRARCSTMACLSLSVGRSRLTRKSGGRLS